MISRSWTRARLRMWSRIASVVVLMLAPAQRLVAQVCRPSTSSNEATLYAGILSFSRKSTADESKGLENNSSLQAFATSLSLPCHSQGV